MGAGLPSSGFLFDLCLSHRESSAVKARADKMPESDS